MANQHLGPRDRIDQLLLRKYANEKVDGEFNENQRVDAGKMMNAIHDYAQMSRTMLTLNAKLQNICRQVNSHSAKYIHIETEDFC